MNIVGGYMDTRINGEDFAITPYLFSVIMNVEVIKVYGLGICWGFWCLHIGLGFGVPRGFPKFIIKKYFK